MIINSADYLLENPALSVSQHDGILNMFSIRHGLYEENVWEERRIPIDAAGVFILDPINATSKLKQKSLDEITSFLGGFSDSAFFERYDNTGDGLNFLKTKYAAEQNLIHTKLIELLAYKNQLENQ